MRISIWGAAVSLLFGAAMLRAASSDVVITEGIVNAPVAAVWNAFTTKEGIESWMVAKTEIDLRVGGIWRTSYSRDSNLDDDTTIQQEILSFDPGRMLSFRTVKPPKGFPFPRAIARTWTVVYFEPEGAARTRIVARMFGYSDDEESQKMRAFFESGNQTTLDHLIQRFQAKAQ